MRKQHEVATLDLGDVHFGRETPNYNRQLCQDRLDTLSDKLIRIYGLLRPTYIFDALVVNLLGDMNDGSGIFPGQESEQDEPDPMTQAGDLAKMLREFTLRQRDTWGRVIYRCVCGNHGRVTKHISPKTNWDRMLYEKMRDTYVPLKRVTVEFDLANEWVRPCWTLGHPYLIYHGADIKMFQQVPNYGIRNRAKNWATTDAYQGFKSLHLGHFHTIGMDSMNQVSVFLNGTFIRHDDWALNCLGLESRTAYWFYGTSARHPITWSYMLDVTDGEGEPSRFVGSPDVPPPGRWNPVLQDPIIPAV